MTEKTLTDFLKLVYERQNALRPTAGNEYARRCLNESAQLLEKAIRDLKDLSKDRTPINADIVRALMLAAEGGVYGEKKENGG